MRCVRNEAPNGFGFAVRKGLEEFRGDAVVIVMADGSDDPRDVVLYYRVLEAGYDCAFGSRFMPGAQVHDYPRIKLDDQPRRQRRHPDALPARLQRHDERVQGLPPRGHREPAAAALAPLQPDRRAAAEGDHARLLLRDRPDLVDQPRGRHLEAPAQRDGQPLPVHRALRLPRVPPEPRRLPPRRRERPRAPRDPRRARPPGRARRAGAPPPGPPPHPLADVPPEPASPAPRLRRRLGDLARRRRVVGLQPGRAEVPRQRRRLPLAGGRARGLRDRAGRPRLALASHHAAGRDPARSRRRLPAHARRLHGQQRAARARRRGPADRDPRLAHDRQAAHDPRLDHRRADPRCRRAGRAVRGPHVVQRRARPRRAVARRGRRRRARARRDRAGRLPRAAPPRLLREASTRRCARSRAR